MRLAVINNLCWPNSRHNQQTCIKAQGEESHVSRYNNDCQVCPLKYAPSSYKTPTQEISFAIDYLKDHSVTCKEFALVWSRLEPSKWEVSYSFSISAGLLWQSKLLQVYKQQEMEATQKKKAKSVWTGTSQVGIVVILTDWDWIALNVIISDPIWFNQYHGDSMGQKMPKKNVFSHMQQTSI